MYDCLWSYMLQSSSKALLIPTTFIRDCCSWFYAFCCSSNVIPTTINNRELLMISYFIRLVQRTHANNYWCKNIVLFVYGIILVQGINAESNKCQIIVKGILYIFVNITMVVQGIDDNCFWPKLSPRASWFRWACRESGNTHSAFCFLHSVCGITPHQQRHGARGTPDAVIFGRTCYGSSCHAQASSSGATTSRSECPTAHRTHYERKPRSNCIDAPLDYIQW